MSEQRRADARRMAELAAAARANEAQAAQVIIDAFVSDAAAQGLAPVPLLATQVDGRRVRTDKTGWYVNRAQTLGIGPDGAWYVLVVPNSVLGRVRGVKLTASPPDLVVNRGGRDGESGDLRDFLARVLAGG